MQQGSPPSESASVGETVKIQLACKSIDLILAAKLDSPRTGKAHESRCLAHFIYLEPGEEK